MVYVPMMVITILDAKSHTTPDTVHVPMNWSSRFWIQSLIQLLCSYELVIMIFSSMLLIFVLSIHHDFVPISCSARISILCQFHFQHASRFHTKIGSAVPTFVLGPELHFRSCPDLPKSTSPKQW